MHVPGRAVKGNRNVLPLAREAPELEQEVHVPGLAAQLSVGDALETGRFLQGDHLPDGGVLGGAKIALARAARLFLESERLQFGRA